MIVIATVDWLNPIQLKFMLQVYESRHHIIPPVSVLKSSIKFLGAPGAAVAIPPADVGHTVLLEHLNEANQPPPRNF
jgi:hypothetical protein